MKREKLSAKTLYMIDTKNIKEIEMRTIGLIDVFGKIEIDITFKDSSKKYLEGISPVQTNEIKSWLEENNLCEKAKLYQF